jgi:S-formylglutathione hydrolase FrmB
MAPFAVATVETGPTSYWHDRAAGRTQTMLVEEFLPLLAKRGLRTDRFAVHGESMGGFGALLLGQTLGRTRVAAVAADGPAIFRRYADASSVAFDDEADFAAHDVYANAARLEGIPVRLVCGSLDPFYGAVRDFARRLHDPPAQTAYATACHHVGYWRSETPAQLRFLAGHLSA